MNEQIVLLLLLILVAVATIGLYRSSSVMDHSNQSP